MICLTVTAFGLVRVSAFLSLASFSDTMSIKSNGSGAAGLVETLGGGRGRPLRVKEGRRPDGSEPFGGANATDVLVFFAAGFAGCLLEMKSDIVELWTTKQIQIHLRGLPLRPGHDPNWKETCQCGYSHG
jgi:hypothetical protein